MKDLAKSTYELIDSGNGLKLERFGDRTLVRPSSICIWKPRLTPNEWKRADARFIPSTTREEGKWEFPRGPFETWQMTHSGCLLELRLQTNGQVGLFPEHGSYLDLLLQFTEKKKESRSIKVLNLFAYTGLATVFAVKLGAHVCHVDLSKKALTWATRNLELNNCETNKVRFICDDAVKFLEREVKRENTYDIVIFDPPSFSRISKENFWKLEDILSTLSSNAFELLSDGGRLIMTCHDPGVTAPMLGNLLYDASQEELTEVDVRELGIKEKNSKRILSAGSFATLTKQ